MGMLSSNPRCPRSSTCIVSHKCSVRDDVKYGGGVAPGLRRENQMVHCPTLVLVPSADCFEAEDRVREVLAPSRDPEATGTGVSNDPPGRYDWYAVGGRFLD